MLDKGGNVYLTEMNQLISKKPKKFYDVIWCWETLNWLLQENQKFLVEKFETWQPTFLTMLAKI
jgi:hypothetical protein